MMGLSRYLFLGFVAGALACEWENHCEGDPCQTFDDCDGNLACTNEKCNPLSGPSPCSWPGHCFGDRCQTEHDCDADMICIGGKCAPPGGEQTCTWPGHCIGNHCSTRDDCSDNLVCKQSTCVDPSATVWPFNIAVTCVNSGSDRVFRVSGDHYNIGTQNIEILIRRQSDWVTLWWPRRFDAVKVAGRPGGSFEATTDLACPVDEENEIHVFGVDNMTGRYRDKIFYA